MSPEAKRRKSPGSTVRATTSGAAIIVSGPNQRQREAMRSNSASVRAVSPNTRSSSNVRGGGRSMPRCAQRSATADSGGNIAADSATTASTVNSGLTPGCTLMRSTASAATISSHQVPASSCASEKRLAS